MDFGCGKMAGEALGAVVGREMHLPAALDHLVRQRLGREEMPARAACREEDRALRHAYSAGSMRPRVRSKAAGLRFSGRRRVSASTMPIEMAIAISDEPP